MPYNTRSQERQQGTGDELSCAIGKQQQTPKMAGTTGSRKRQKVMERKQSCANSKQPKAPRTPDYTPPCSPTYAPAYSPPDHTQLCMVDGKPVTTVALSVWDGDPSSSKHKCTPKSPPCSPKYAPTRAQRPGSGTRCGTPTYALGPV
jgi:hypothetical protein